MTTYTYSISRCCIRCQDSSIQRAGLAIGFRMMVVCPECGNKRCPKATFHGHACTGSNEAGQPGSDFPKFRP